jgi:hypothetical protein
MEYVYIVEHVYEKDEIEEIKFIGIFSDEKKVKEAVDFLFTRQGFNQFSKECFEINKVKINDFEWKDGFISWQEAQNE